MITVIHQPSSPVFTSALDTFSFKIGGENATVTISCDGEELLSEESKLQQEFSAEVTEMSTGKMILGQPINSKIEPHPSDEFLFSNFIFEFSDLQFPAEGNYQFSFKIGNVENSIPLKVYFQK